MKICCHFQGGTGGKMDRHSILKQPFSFEHTQNTLTNQDTCIKSNLIQQLCCHCHHTLRTFKAVYFWSSLVSGFAFEIHFVTMQQPLDQIPYFQSL
jgi:hypothetical protein